VKTFFFGTTSFPGVQLSVVVKRIAILV